MRWPLVLLLSVFAACATRIPSDQTLRVMTWNIHHGAGLDGKVDIDRIAAEIRRHDPDLVALQEVDRGVRRTAGIDLAGELAHRLGMQVAFGKNLDFQGGDYGNAVLSRLPIESHANHHYAMLRAGEQRGLLRIRVRVAGRALEFWNTHIDYRPDDRERRSNARELLAMLAKTDADVVLCGDFNDLPGSAVHTLLLTALRDAWCGEGAGHTFPAQTPNKRIDWVLIHGDLAPRNTCVPATTASDHRPVVVDLLRLNEATRMPPTGAPRTARSDAAAGR